jgi:hypothetical protein
MNWHSIELKGFQKENISESQIRFKSKNIVMHIQTDKFEKAWNPKNLKQEIDEMYKSRHSMYELMGFSEVEFESYKLDEINKHQELKIFGSYKKPDDQKVYFIEDNIYFEKKFIQIKILNTEKKLENSDLENILKEINISKVEI